MKYNTDSLTYVNHNVCPSLPVHPISKYNLIYPAKMTNLLKNLKSISLYYEFTPSFLAQRESLIRRCSLQRALYSQITYNRLFKHSLTSFNIETRKLHNRFRRIFIYKLSPQLLRGLTTREQIPPFGNIPLSRLYSLHEFGQTSPLSYFLISAKKKSLKRVYTSLTPFITYTKFNRKDK